MPNNYCQPIPVRPPATRCSNPIIHRSVTYQQQAPVYYYPTPTETYTPHNRQTISCPNAAPKAGLPTAVQIFPEEADTSKLKIADSLADLKEKQALIAAAFANPANQTSPLQIVAGKQTYNFYYNAGNILFNHDLGSTEAKSLADPEKKFAVAFDNGVRSFKEEKAAATTVAKPEAAPIPKALEPLPETPVVHNKLLEKANFTSVIEAQHGKELGIKIFEVVASTALPATDFQVAKDGSNKPAVTVQYDERTKSLKIFELKNPEQVAELKAACKKFDDENPGHKIELAEPSGKDTGYYRLSVSKK